MIDTGTECETESELEDDVVAKAASAFLRPLPSRFALGLCPKTLRVLGNKMSSGRGASGARSEACAAIGMVRLEGAEAQQDKLRRVGLMLRSMTS
jgi:hypothetical protein